MRFAGKFAYRRDQCYSSIAEISVITQPWKYILLEPYNHNKVLVKVRQSVKGQIQEVV